MKKIIIIYLITSMFVFTSTTYAYSVNGSSLCYSDGCINLGSETGKMWELVTSRGDQSVQSVVDFIYNGFYVSHGVTGLSKDSYGRITYAACGNNKSFSVSWLGCQNGANDYPTCKVCAQGSNMKDGSCICQNGAHNAPACNACPSGQAMYNNICMCENGATNVPTCNQCPVGSSMIDGKCVCSNAATPMSNCSVCPSGKIFDQGICIAACDMTNVCGQNVQGVLKNGTCSPVTGTSPNDSCITQFNVSTDNVSPNGSVEFSWQIAKVPGIGSRCGFVDLTTPTPRPIPGLQNLDPTIDRTRINNIQTTTRFCLVCQFYKLIDNSVLGDAAVHQWVRVIRIGEQ